MTGVTLVRRIAARPSIVFDALCTAEGIAQWFGPDAGPVLFAQSEPRVGGAFRARFRMLDGSEHECAGEYLEVIAPERLVLTWRWTHGGDPEEAGRTSRVEMRLRAVDGGTELTFTHAQLRGEPSRASHEIGWIGALDKLVRRFGRQEAAS